MSLNRRATLVKRKVTGEDPLVDAVLSDPDGLPGTLYRAAASLNTNKTKRQYIEACLIASQDLKRISDLLGIPLETIAVYSKFFYDLEGIDKLSKIELVNQPGIPRDETLLKLWAFSQGLDFIAWRLGERVPINPIEGLQDMFTTCIMKGKEAMFSGNASEESKEATKWVKLSLDLARLLKMWVMDSDAARADLEVALRQVVPDFKGLDSLDDVEDVEDITADTTQVSLEDSSESADEKPSKKKTKATLAAPATETPPGDLLSNI